VAIIAKVNARHADNVQDYTAAALAHFAMVAKWHASAAQADAALSAVLCLILAELRAMNAKLGMKPDEAVRPPPVNGNGTATWNDSVFRNPLGTAHRDYASPSEPSTGGHVENIEELLDRMEGEHGRDSHYLLSI
jgi:hypothetical protein